MKAIPMFCLVALAAALTAAAAEDVIPGSSTIVVVAAGDHEPQSIGSYDLRVYAGTDPKFPYDRYVTGTVRPRDGTIEDLLFPDLDADGAPDIVVTMRSVGTGGYLAADAFSLQGQELKFLGSVAGLAKDADPVSALVAELE